MCNLKIIITLALIIAMVFSIAIVPSHAVLGVDDVVLGSLGAWLLDYGAGKVLDYLGSKVAGIVGEPDVPDHFHTWRVSAFGGKTDGTHTVEYECTFCGKKMLADRDAIMDAYDSYVDDLPATCYNSDGHLIWNPTFSDVLPIGRCSSGWSTSSLYYGCYLYELPYSSSSAYYDSVRCYEDIGSNCYVFHFGNLSSGYCLIRFRFSAFVSGSYRQIRCPSRKISGVRNSGETFSNSYSYTVGSYFHYYSGDTISLDTTVTGDTACSSYFVSFFFPVYEIIPDSDLDQYNINTRLSSVYGDVAYYDVDGNLQVSKNTTIVNEGDSYYYNPVTNNTYYVNNWNYDYSDRSYHLTTDTGDATTITYGDEYITIQEGDTVYNIYYYYDGAQLPETHTHEWYQTGQLRATCTDYGTKTYTCYTCGEQKTEVLPALGHAWLQRGYVDASYDDEGELIDKAHVLYVCSRCDEEYKDYDGVGPPETPSDGGDSSTDSSGILAWLKEFKEWLGEKLDALTGGGGDVNIDNDYNITYTDDDGEERDTNVLDIIGAFNWWKDVADIGKTLVDQVSAAEVAAYAYAADMSGGNPAGAPSIPINLGLAQSVYGVDYGGEVEMLDLSWYTPYKKTVDDLISGFMWLFFVWALFRHAPSIISGVGLTANRIDGISENLKGRKGK